MNKYGDCAATGMYYSCESLQWMQHTAQAVILLHMDHTIMDLVSDGYIQAMRMMRPFSLDIQMIQIIFTI